MNALQEISSLAGAAATSIIFVMTSTCLLHQNVFVATKVCLPRQKLCHDKIMFVATKMILVAASANDKI